MGSVYGAGGDPRKGWRGAQRSKNRSHERYRGRPSRVNPVPPESAVGVGGVPRADEATRQGTQAQNGRDMTEPGGWGAVRQRGG